MSAPTVVVPSEFTTAEGTRTLANYLRTNVKSKSGVEFEKRVDYFKGKKLVACILEGKKWPKSLPQVTDRAVAVAIGEHLLHSAPTLFHRSDRIDEKRGILRYSKNTVFEEAGYYTWIFEGNLVISHILTAVLVGVTIACCLLPLWPMVARKALWYCSVTFLLLNVGLCVVRWLVFGLCWTVGIEFWIFPRLFDESLSFVDSFKPVYTIERGAPGQMMFRFGVMCAMGAFCYWAYSQPTEFDEMMKAQKGFVDDLYAGKLLPDASQSMKDTMYSAQSGYGRSTGRPGQGNIYTKNMPKLDEILSELDAEEEEAAEAEEQAPSEGNLGDDEVQHNRGRGRAGAEEGGGGVGNSDEDHVEVDAIDEEQQAQDMIDRMLSDDGQDEELDVDED